MKKEYLIILVVLVSMNVSGQSKFGVETGFNFAWMLKSDIGQPEGYSKKALAGLHLRAAYELFLNDYISVDFGLGIANKGLFETYETTPNVDSLPSTVHYYRTSLAYVDIPIVIKSALVMEKSKFYFGIGPNLSIGFAGNIDDDAYINDSLVSFTNRRVNWGSDEIMDDYKRFDLGMKIIFGFEYKGFYFQSGFEYGFLNIDAYDIQGFFSKNFVISTSFGYKFLLNNK